MTTSTADSDTGGSLVISPQDFHRSYVEAFNSRSVESLVTLYESDAAFVPQPGQVVSGHAAIREVLRHYQAIGKMAAETRYCITSGNVALASASWEIKGTGPEGRPVAVQGTSADLLRCQADSRWLLVVDHPFGGA